MRLARRIAHCFAAAMLAGTLVAPAGAQDVVNIANVAEFTGPGATASANWRNGVELAVDEINAAGGILGRRVAITHYDTQTNPGIAREAVRRAIEDGAYVLLGPVFSGPIGASMQLAQRAGVPQITGGEAANLSRQGNPYFFRSSLNQAHAMPKLADFFRDQIRAKSVAVLWINNDFGKGGRDAIIPELQKRGIRIAADLLVESGETEFAAIVTRLKGVEADALFVYLNEAESAGFLRAAKEAGMTKPIVGETTLLGAKVIELAGAAANGAKGHIGLSVDAPAPGLAAFGRKFLARYNYKSDHNGIKGYTSVYAVKAITERIGKFDRAAFAQAMRGGRITPQEEPGILIETKWTQAGDIDRQSFLAEIVDGRQVIMKTLPMLNP